MSGIRGALFEDEYDLVSIGYEGLRLFIDGDFVKLKVVDHNKESFNNEVFIGIPDGVKVIVFPCFEDVGAVVPKESFYVFDSALI